MCQHLAYDIMAYFRLTYMAWLCLYCLGNIANGKRHMTREQAIELAKFDRSYSARQIRGRWCVWCGRSDHAVEFDQTAIEWVRAALSSRCEGCGQ